MHEVYVYMCFNEAFRLEAAAKEKYRCPPPFPQPRETPYSSNGPMVAFFSKVKKQYSQLGKIDPKRLSEYGVNNQEPIHGKCDKAFCTVFRRLNV